jgi:hypothetical protein
MSGQHNIQILFGRHANYVVEGAGGSLEQGIHGIGFWS